MTSKTYAQLGVQSTLVASDLLAAWRPSGPGPLKSITGSVLLGFTDTYYLRLDGTLPMTGTLLWYTGAQSTPGLAISGDPDTGFYGVAANDLGLSVGGVQVAHWNSTGCAITGALAVSGVITSPTISAASTSLSQISSSLSNTNSSLAGVSTSLSGVSSSLGGVSTSLGNVSTSTSNNTSSVSNVASSLTGVSTSLTGVSTSLTTAVTGKVTNPPVGAYTAVLADANASIQLNNNGTIPANASVAYAIGTFLEWVNATGGSVTVGITSDNLFYGTSSGTRTVAAGGVLGCRKTAATSWRLIYGVGVT